VAIVNEVVVVHDVTVVPKSPPAVRGLFNLRGTAVPLVELRDVLGLGAASSHGPDETTTALVLRHDDLLVGFPIDRMEAVVLAGQGTFTESAGTEHPAVHGFLELGGFDSRTVTLLESSALLVRLEAVRFVAEGA
jgi:purine-binding chemotaxis protein CheW